LKPDIDLQNITNRENYVGAMNPSAPAALQLGLTGE
jgi:hypothetical protein